LKPLGAPRLPDRPLGCSYGAVGVAPRTAVDPVAGRERRPPRRHVIEDDLASKAVAPIEPVEGFVGVHRLPGEGHDRTLPMA
jgi:hypothetical protein